MPTFSFTSPDGRQYSVDGPDGATKEQAFGILQQRLAAATPSVAPPQAADQSIDPAHAGAAQGERIAKDASDYLEEARNSPVKAVLSNIVGPGEAALNLLSGAGSSVVGGLAGLGDLAKSGIQNQINNGLHYPTSDEFDAAAAHAADVAAGIQKAGTYQPRTSMGKLASEIAAVPLNAASEGLRSIGGDVGQAVGGDKGRAAGEEIGGVTPAVLATLAGGGSLLRRPGAAIVESPVENALSAGDRIEPQITPVDAAVENGERAATVGDSKVPAIASDADDSPSLAQAVGDTSANDEPPVTLYRISRQTEGGALPHEDQVARAQILQHIGMEDARASAIAGDSAEGATQAQIAKFTDSPAGQAAKAQFDAERSALQDHARDIVQDTGGSLGTDNSTLNARGQIIAAPFDGLRTYFDDSIKKLYDAADAQSDGRPLTQLSGLSDLLNTESAFAGKAANSTLGSGIKSYLREQNILGKDGEMTPVTPQQAEGIKQYINSQWSPDTSGLAGKIKSTIDDDVLKGAGGDIYAEARNLFKMQKATLDNPSGVSSLMDYDRQTPINRTTPFEKIPDKLTGLPVAQFGHVVDVLNKILDPQYDTPPLLQLQAADALNEIRGHMANGLLEAGSKYQTTWNAPGVTQYLKNNSAKFPMVFSRTALRKISDLNDAGHILSVDKSYPGSAAQGALAVKRGLVPLVIGKSLAGAGGLSGSFAGPVGATVGAAIGSAAGDGLAASIGGRAALNRFQSGMVRLHDVVAPPAKQQPSMRVPIGVARVASPSAIAAAAVAQHQQTAGQVAIRALASTSVDKILEDATSAASNAVQRF